MQDFLDYIDGKMTDDELVQEIDSEVVTAKNREEWKRHYWIKIPFCLFNLLTSCPQSRQL